MELLAYTVMSYNYVRGDLMAFKMHNQSKMVFKTCYMKFYFNASLFYGMDFQWGQNIKLSLIINLN